MGTTALSTCAPSDALRFVRCALRCHQMHSEMGTTALSTGMSLMPFRRSITKAPSARLPDSKGECPPRRASVRVSTRSSTCNDHQIAMRSASISGNQRQSAAISGNQRVSTRSSTCNDHQIAISTAVLRSLVLRSLSEVCPDENLAHSDPDENLAHSDPDENLAYSEALRRSHGAIRGNQGAIREPSLSNHLPDEHLATEPVLPTKVELTLAQLRQRRRPQVYR